MKIKTTFEKVNEGLRTIQKNGGRVAISGSGGSVSIQGVKARFHFDQDTDILQVVIDDKPWLASNAMIEEKISEFFG